MDSKGYHKMQIKGDTMHQLYFSLNMHLWNLLRLWTLCSCTCITGSCSFLEPIIDGRWFWCTALINVLVDYFLIDTVIVITTECHFLRATNFNIYAKILNYHSGFKGLKTCHIDIWNQYLPAWRRILISNLRTHNGVSW